MGEELPQLEVKVNHLLTMRLDPLQQILAPPKPRNRKDFRAEGDLDRLPRRPSPGRVEEVDTKRGETEGDAAADEAGTRRGELKRFTLWETKTVSPKGLSVVVNRGARWAGLEKSARSRWYVS